MYLDKQKCTYSDLVLCLFHIRTNKTFFNRLFFKDLDIPFIEYRDQGSETIHYFFYKAILNSKFKHRTHHLEMNYYVNFLGHLGSNGFQLI